MLFLIKRHGETLSPHLHQEEIDCHCAYKDCKVQLISPKLVTAFQNTRDEWDNPIIVLSGFRCQRHNSDVGGVIASKHTLGHAIDITPQYSGTVHINKLKIDLCKLQEIAERYFDVVIRYDDDNFLHCHLSVD